MPIKYTAQQHGIESMYRDRDPQPDPNGRAEDTDGCGMNEIDLIASVLCLHGG